MKIKSFLALALATGLLVTSFAYPSHAKSSGGSRSSSSSGSRSSGGSPSRSGSSFGSGSGTAPAVAPSRPIGTTTGGTKNPSNGVFKATAPTSKTEAITRAKALNSSSKPMTPVQLKSSGAIETQGSKVFRPNDPNVTGAENAQKNLNSTTPGSVEHTTALRQYNTHRTVIVNDYPTVYYPVYTRGMPIYGYNTPVYVQPSEYDAGDFFRDFFSIVLWIVLFVIVFFVGRVLYLVYKNKKDNQSDNQSRF